MKNFFSNGKLLLSGEYLVLDSALALAIPTGKGQSLSVETTKQKGIHWKSLDEKGTVWFQASFDLNASVSETQNKVLFQLLKILKSAKKLNSSFLEKENVKVTTTLDFPRNWGLGTSSTLITNIAQWANVDAYTILQNSFGGSGYDIAVAQSKTPILYQLKDNIPKILQVELNWSFTKYLFFVHLNQKQDSKQGISHYKSQSISSETISEISTITEDLKDCKTLEEFESLIKKHELLISKAIKLPTVKEKLFPDYPKVIKSLGAWGGDFILVVGGEKEKDYFKEKGYSTIVSFDEMIL